MTRTQALITGLLILTALVALVVIWSTIIEPRHRLDVQRHVAVMPHLPPAWEGSTIALIADLQIGMWWHNTGMVERAVREAIAERPAAVVVAGDLLYHADDADVTLAMELLRPVVDADIPLVLVLGNHDYRMGSDSEQPDTELADRLAERLRGIGAHILRNQTFTLRSSAAGPPLHVVGIDSLWADRSRVAAALAGVPSSDARVVVTHNPKVFEDLPANSSPLTMAGHTHGGQIRLPFFPTGVSWLRIATANEMYAAGWSGPDRGQPGNRLYVNRGIGFSLVPVRFNCPPELTLFTLTARGSDHPAG